MTMLLAIGCDWNPLRVSNPTAIGDSDLDNAQGAELLRTEAIDRMNDAFASLGSFVRHAGIFSDELFADVRPDLITSLSSGEPIDRRNGLRTLSAASALHQARHAASFAIPRLRAFGPRAHLGQMFAVRGIVKLSLADAVCSGQVFNEFVDGRTVFTQPLSTKDAYASALNDLDSAVVLTADSARLLNLSRVARARALLELGRFGEAAQAAGPVPTAYVFSVEVGGSSNNMFGLTSSTTFPLSVSNNEGGNGLDFVSANDPRVPATFAKKSIYDGTTDLYELNKYGSNQTPIPLATGVEARLIEAEAALQSGNADWLTILNDLRATQISPAMDSLTDPGTPEARLDLLFRERAFWLFGTGRRLGDLRRLVRVYGRSVAQTFPSGTYRMGGSYESVTAFALDPAETMNPAVTGCTDR